MILWNITAAPRTYDRRSMLIFVIVYIAITVAVLVAVVSVAIATTGCTSLEPPKDLKGPTIVKHPDASMVVTEVDGEWLRVAIWDDEISELVDYGWIKMSAYVGWTIHKFNWESLTP